MALCNWHVGSARKRRDGLEDTLDLLTFGGSVIAFTQKGGGRVGSSPWFGGFSASWPMATISVDPDAVQLSVIQVVHRFEPTTISGIERVGPDWAVPGFHGIRIRHTVPELPAYVMFWSFNRRALIGALVDAGYTVH